MFCRSPRVPSPCTLSLPAPPPSPRIPILSRQPPSCSHTPFPPALVVDGSALSYLWKEVVGRDGAAREGGKGADVRREKVYNTMFNVPWRCELVRGVEQCKAVRSGEKVEFRKEREGRKGADVRREKVYNTMFNVPWRCELVRGVERCKVSPPVSCTLLIPPNPQLILIRYLLHQHSFLLPSCMLTPLSFSRNPNSPFASHTTPSPDHHGASRLSLPLSGIRAHNSPPHFPFSQSPPLPPTTPLPQLIIMGYLVCLDSFLSLLAILPIRLFLLLLRLLLAPWRGRLHLGVDDIADFGKGVIIVCGVLALQQADVSLIYHWIRGQNILKLVVIYNVLEVMDKLCQSLGCDVLQMTLNTAARVAAAATAGSSAGAAGTTGAGAAAAAAAGGTGAGTAGSAAPAAASLPTEALRFIIDEAIAVACFLLHALVLLTQAVTLNVAINSHNHILVTLLVSNNFAEVKSNVFKRFSRENIHKLACLDTVERFHLSCHLLFVVVQNVVKGQGTSLSFFIRNVCTVWGCEMLVDNLKHSFLAKFNEIKPETYSDFLLSLCRQ
ncbi:unnamed protein product, partial [Closterium sp. NIES-53]